MNKKNPKGAGRKHKFTVPAITKPYLVPKCKLKEFNVFYEDLTAEFLRKKE